MNNSESSSVFVISSEQSTDQQNEENPEEHAGFEKALEDTGTGKFNLLLFVLALPHVCSAMFDISAMSYVFPVAQCDLNLSLDDKGILNAVTYIGMISSAFLWGYIADTFGRKPVIVWGSLLDGFFVILSGFSQNYTMLVITKFLTGFMISGPFSSIVSYWNEFCPMRYRSLIPVVSAVLYSVANISLSYLGLLIFTDSINVSLFNDYINLNSWNIYLFVCSIPSWITGVSYAFLPETPRFLMTAGKNEKALEVFQYMYSCNSGRPRNTYPVTALQNNINENNKHGVTNQAKIEVFKEGCMQILPLFHRPYLGAAVLIFSIQFLILTGLNTLKLWLPQLFTAINEYHTIYAEEQHVDMCVVLEMVNPSNEVNNGSCYVNYNNDTYNNNGMAAVTSLAVYLVGVMIIKKIGKKWILVSSSCSAGLCGFGLYFMHNDVGIIILSGLFIGFMGIASNVTFSIAVDIFPTTLRTMIIALTYMVGRLGTILGSMAVPVLVRAGCIPFFLFIGIVSLGGSFLSLLLPSTDKKALE